MRSSYHAADADRLISLHTITLPVPWDLKSVNVHPRRELDEGFLLAHRLRRPPPRNALRYSRSGAGGALASPMARHPHAAADPLPSRPHRPLVENPAPDRSAVDHASRRRPVPRRTRARGRGAPGYAGGDAHQESVPPELAAGMEGALRGNRPAFRTHHPHQILEGAETLSVRGGTFDVIWTPGHTPGHVCLYSPEHRILISGDHVLQKITPNISWHPQHDMLANYLSSLDLLLPYDIDVVIPSPRNAVWRKSSSPSFAVPRTIMRNAAAQLLKRVTEAPMTAHELVLRAVAAQAIRTSIHNFAVFRNSRPSGIHVEARSDRLPNPVPMARSPGCSSNHAHVITLT